MKKARSGDFQKLSKAMSKVLIDIEGVKKRYAKASEDSLKSVSLKIFEGEKFGIFGPNGAGKTTLISILSHILPFDKGSISYYSNGNPIDFKSIKQCIGFVPQDLALYDDLTARQNISYFGALYNMDAASIKRRSKELFDLLGLSGVADKKVRTYSGGMKRRLNLIAGLIHKPSILFLDEPTVGVDIQSRNAILTFLDRINSQGTSLIYTSHHLDEAEKLCDRVGVIDYGELIAVGNISDLLNDNGAENLTQLVIKLTGKEFRDNV